VPVVSAAGRIPRVGCRLLLLVDVCACGRVDTVVGSQSLPEAGDEAGQPATLPRAVYIEAESGQLSGFTIATDPTVSGGAYILPPPESQLLSTPGDASADYTFTVAPGVYFLWGRIRSPSVDNNTLWVTVDNGPTYLWRLSTGVIWYWGRITNGVSYTQPISFPLDGGAHALVIRNADPKVGLDRLYVTSLGDTPVPANDTPCDPPNSIQLVDGGCQPSCGSMIGDCVGTTQQCGGNPVYPVYDCTICCRPPEDAGSD
jgi:hypothetical protein